MAKSIAKTIKVSGTIIWGADNGSFPCRGIIRENDITIAAEFPNTPEINVRKYNANHYKGSAPKVDVKCDMYQFRDNRFCLVGIWNQDGLNNNFICQMDKE